MDAFSGITVRDFVDRVLRRFLEDLDNFRECIEVINPKLAARLDFPKARILPRKILLHDFRSREADLFVEVPFKEGNEKPVVALFLVEQQTNPEPAMPLKHLVPMVNFWEKEWKAWEDLPPPRPPLRLTLILTIAFHTGHGRWTTSLSLRDLVDGPEEYKDAIPDWTTILWRTGDYTTEQLLAFPQPAVQVLAIVRGEREPAESYVSGCCGGPWVR